MCLEDEAMLTKGGGGGGGTFQSFIIVLQLANTFFKNSNAVG